MQYHETVFEKYGIKVTNNPFPMGYTLMEEEAISYIYQLINSGRTGKRILNEIKEYKERFSDLPEMHNYLGGAYLAHGKEKEAIKIIKETIRRFPDYVFGKLQWAELCLIKNNPEKIPTILGSDVEIDKFTNEDGFVHSSFYLAFFNIHGRYFLAINNIDKAKECLGKILTYDKKAFQAELLGKKILEHTLNSITNQFRDFKEFRIQVEDKATYIPLQVDIKPTFLHSEIELFYKKSIQELSVDEIREVINLPKDSLVKDLELVIEDAIVRYRWFYNKYEEYDESEQSAVGHALKFLCELKSEQSLQKVFNLLRQKNEFLDFWFGEIDYYFDNYLFSVSKNSLREFQNFIYEPYVNYRSKSVVIDAISQCYFHYPEMKEDILSILQEISDFFLNTKDDTILDTGIIMDLINVYLDHNLTEFIPYIEKFFDNKWVDDMMFGEKETVIKEINTVSSKWRKDPFPNDVFEDYSEVYLDREEEEESDKDPFQKEEDEVQEFIMSMMFGGLSDDHEEDDYYEEDDYSYNYNSKITETYKREQPKVGRNEPCPCGSGKKYKKCCLNK